MPVLSKFRIKTPLDDFENYLGEEMNTFSGFYSEGFNEEEFTDVLEEPTQEKNEAESIKESYWKRMLNSIFKFSSDLFL
jgi:hypothetical protein